MNEPMPKLVLHIGQQMIDVLDVEDMADVVLGDALYWDEVGATWLPNGPANGVTTRIADCLNRMKFSPEVRE